MPKPLDPEISLARAERERLLAELAGVDARLKALMEAQLRLLDAEVELRKALHAEHNDSKSVPMQEHSLGVRIAAGRRKKSTSRQAQIDAGMKDQDVADLLKVGRSTVCKWHLGTLAIAPEYADKLATKGIPRTVWKKIG